jgi:hypothetical protein
LPLSGSTGSPVRRPENGTPDRAVNRSTDRSATDQ